MPDKIILSMWILNRLQEDGVISVTEANVTMRKFQEMVFKSSGVYPGTYDSEFTDDNVERLGA